MVCKPSNHPSYVNLSIFKLLRMDKNTHQRKRGKKKKRKIQLWRFFFSTLLSVILFFSWLLFFASFLSSTLLATESCFPPLAKEKQHNLYTRPRSRLLVFCYVCCWYYLTCWAKSTMSLLQHSFLLLHIHVTCLFIPQYVCPRRKDVGGVCVASWHEAELMEKFHWLITCDGEETWSGLSVFSSHCTHTPAPIRLILMM